VNEEPGRCPGFFLRDANIGDVIFLASFETVVPAEAGTHAERATVANRTVPNSQLQHGFPLAREVVSGSAGNDVRAEVSFSYYSNR
jgi:hypothetical protein